MLQMTGAPDPVVLSTFRFSSAPKVYPLVAGQPHLSPAPFYGRSILSILGGNGWILDKPLSSVDAPVWDRSNLPQLFRIYFYAAALSFVFDSIFVDGGVIFCC